MPASRASPGSEFRPAEARETCSEGPDRATEPRRLGCCVGGSAGTSGSTGAAGTGCWDARAPARTWSVPTLALLHLEQRRARCWYRWYCAKAGWKPTGGEATAVEASARPPCCHFQPEKRTQGVRERAQHVYIGDSAAWAAVGRVPAAVVALPGRRRTHIRILWIRKARETKRPKKKYSGSIVCVSIRKYYCPGTGTANTGTHHKYR